MTPKYVLSALLIASATVVSFAQWQAPTNATPAFFAKMPAKTERTGRILHGKQLTGRYFAHSYQIGPYKNAAKVSDRLYLMPCYCRCDRAEGHKSLHSCFEGTHGAVCATCLKEVTYVYQMTRKGKSVAQIRTGIERGEWEHVDLLKAYPETAAR